MAFFFLYMHSISTEKYEAARALNALVPHALFVFGTCFMIGGAFVFYSIILVSIITIIILFIILLDIHL